LTCLSVIAVVEGEKTLMDGSVVETIWLPDG
jgi:hypothetical protein